MREYDKISLNNTVVYNDGELELKVSLSQFSTVSILEIVQKEGSREVAR